MVWTGNNWPFGQENWFCVKKHLIFAYFVGHESELPDFKLQTSYVEGRWHQNWAHTSGRYLVVLGQNMAVLVASVRCFQKMYGLHDLNLKIIEYLKKEKLLTDKQMDRQIEFPFVDLFWRRGRVKQQP